MYKITIVVSTHNRSDFLTKSFLTYPRNKNIEILIIENGSTEKEINKYKKIFGKEENVNLVHLPVGNLTASRNMGIRLSKGEYIVFIDDDDSMTRRFSNWLSRFSGNENIYRFPYWRKGKFVSPARFGVISKKSIFKAMQVTTWMVKKEFLAINEIKFNESFWWLEDQFFAAQMFDTHAKQKYIRIPSIRYNFLNSEGSMERHNLRKVEDDFKIFEFLGEKEFELLVRLRATKKAIRWVNWGMYDHDLKNALDRIQKSNIILKNHEIGINLKTIKKRF